MTFNENPNDGLGATGQTDSFMGEQRKDFCRQQHHWIMETFTNLLGMHRRQLSRHSHDDLGDKEGLSRLP